jgi:hypothetical protein
MNTNMGGSNKNTLHDTNDNIPRNTMDKDQALARANDIDEMKQWAEGFRVKKSIPNDLLSILAKDGAKQMKIFMKNMIWECRRMEEAHEDV